MSNMLNLADYAEAARSRLSKEVYEYYAGAALDEVTLRENRAAWERIPIYYRVLAGVEPRVLETTVLGRPVSMPILIAPTAFHKLACKEGEIAAARAARRAGTLFILSSLSNTAMEEVFREAASPKWFQLYIYKDRGVTRDLIARAEAAGAEAIVLTVDAPVWGNRERDSRNGFQLPPGLAVENVVPAGKGDFPKVEGSGLAAYVNTLFDGALSWRHLEWLCAATKLPVVVKGVCRGDDARRCAEHGAQAVMVSNHGGRQLDTSPATVAALPHVVSAVQGACEIYVDGGVRRGADVLKALALGARGVLIGRPVLWGLAVDGEAGVVRVLEILRQELSDAMALAGCTRLSDIDASLLKP
ncbi:MAG: alpha-hydroxy acid oxidase [Nevskiales bacterium]